MLPSFLEAVSLSSSIIAGISLLMSSAAVFLLDPVMLAGMTSGSSCRVVGLLCFEGLAPTAAWDSNVSWVH